MIKGGRGGGAAFEKERKEKKERKKNTSTHEKTRGKIYKTGGKSFLYFFFDKKSRQRERPLCGVCGERRGRAG